MKLNSRDARSIPAVPHVLIELVYRISERLPGLIIDHGFKSRFFFQLNLIS